MHIDTHRFRFISDALNGTGGFRPHVHCSGDGTATISGASYLVKYPREGEAKYARRNEVAWYTNDLRGACVRFAGYMSKHPPMREIKNPLLAAFENDADWRGNALDVFWSSFTIQAKARGCMLLLVDMPQRQEVPDTQAQQLSERRLPYMAAIKPEQVREYTLDERGRLDNIAIQDGKFIREWDRMEWRVLEEQRIIDQGEHGLGVCPVLAFAEDEFPDEGEFAQIADLSRRMFNLRSELDEILRAQTFSLLTYQIPPDQTTALDTTKIAGQISTNNMLIHSGGTPAFIAPPDGPARIYLEKIAILEEKMRRIGHVVEAPDRAESGIALQIRFQQLNSALGHWANRMEDLERRVWDLVSRWLGLSETASVQWADDYAISDPQSELDILAAMQTSGFSEETLQAKRRQIVALDFSGMPEDTMQSLLDAEANGAQER